MSYNKNIIFLILFSTILPVSLFGQKNNFRAPVNFQMDLSGNFGELRPDHFHAGIDITTYGVRGKKIFAIADGYVSRIKVSANGYGKALYIHHPEEGVTSVFGHLQRFNHEINQYVLNQQYKHKKHEIQLFPEANQFPVKKGDLIAYSGNSGRSGGPHIHFEIRELNNQHPLNPLLFDFNIKDNIAPKIFNLAVYSHSGNKTKQRKHIYNTDVVSGNEYQVLEKDTLFLDGSYSFGIRTFDFLNGADNWCGIYDLKLLIDSSIVYHHRMDEFAFSETRYINSFIDFEEKTKNNLSIQKTHLQPNNHLSIYNFVKGKGIVTFNNNKTHNLQYIVKDVYGNRSVLNFIVKNDTARAQGRHPADTINYDKIMPFNQSNKFTGEDIRIEFPASAFYDTLHFNHHQQTTSNEIFFSDIHQVHNKYTPVHKSYSLTIKSENLSSHLADKAFIAKIKEEEEYKYIGGNYLNGSVTASTREFGKYVIMTDTLAPKIELIGSAANLKSQRYIRLKVSDNLSGIKTYNGYIDGEWVLFEYDPKNNILEHKFETHPLEKNKEHELELYVGDEKNNISTFYIRFER
jgi:hypothetical protein